MEGHPRGRRIVDYRRWITARQLSHLPDRKRPRRAIPRARHGSAARAPGREGYRSSCPKRVIQRAEGRGLPEISRSMAATILFAAIYDRPIHIAHVSLKEEILLIKAAKEKGIKVTCEATPHHLFLSNDDIPAISHGHPGRGEVRPRLATKEDVDALWHNMDVIDCFATGHAPHTLEEKDSENPPPGFPGLETALPLLLTAVKDGRLKIEDIIAKMYTNPRKIFSLPEQPETWIEVDEDAEYEIKAANQFTLCGWTPFEGWKVKGCVTRVVLRGREAFKDGKVLVEKGFGKNVRIKE